MTAPASTRAVTTTTTLCILFVGNYGAYNAHHLTEAPYKARVACQGMLMVAELDDAITLDTWKSRVIGR